MAFGGWEFWRLTTASSGDLAWLGLTRPGGRSKLDRQKVWTLIPSGRFFIANWFVSEDHVREVGKWIHENIGITDARDIICDVPEPASEDIDRIVRPESLLTLDQIDRFTVLKVMGTRADRMLRRRV